MVAEQLAASYAQEVGDLASRLVRANSINPPGGEIEAAEVAAEFLRAQGLKVDIDVFDGVRANLTARLEGVGRVPGLLLSGHLDTVPVPNVENWSRDPWSGAIEDGTLYGRGSLDMKGGLAALCVAAARFARADEALQGDIVIALTAGEETNSLGANRICSQDELGPLSGVIVAEPTNLDVGYTHRGALWLKVKAKGRSAHGSQPHEGVNAVRLILDWLGDWSEIEAMVTTEAHPVLGQSTASLNQICGGLAPNVIPDYAEIVLDIRTLPGQRHDLLIRQLQGESEAVEIEVIRDAPPLATDLQDPLVNHCKEAALDVAGEVSLRGLPYTTDAAIFAEELGVPAVVIGPGSERLAHTDNESISVSELASAAAIYETVIRRVLN